MGVFRLPTVAATALVLALAGVCYADSPKWWNKQWPYRARVECPAGEGDVAHVTLTLGGRITDDGRDLRLIDADGSWRSFDILHHDPGLRTTIRFRPELGKATTTWLYYGNGDAGQTDTTNPGLSYARAMHEQWQRQRARRQEALQKERQLESKRTATRQPLQDLAPNAPASQTAKLKQRIAELDARLKALDIPELGPEPNVPEPWNPERGVLLRVYRKHESGHPGKLNQLYRMIEQSTLEGAGYRDGISDGFNPFGPSDRYISSYSAYLRIDEPGRYGLATVSDDGSWVLADDQQVVAWPGGHGHGEGARGEKNGVVRFDKGVVHIRYYHEEGTGNQMAYLAWRPPGEKRFAPIPEEQWLSVREANVARYEARDREIFAVPDVETRDTYWVYDSNQRQATRLRFRDRSAAPNEATARWQFGDGLEDAGDEVEHVYFRIGRPKVTLTVRDDAGRSDSVTVRPRLYKVDVVARQAHNYANTKDYARAAAGYDTSKMARDDLERYAEFWGFIERWPEHYESARAFVERFGSDPAAAELAASGAEAALEPAVDKPREGARLLELAADRAESWQDKADLALQRADVVAWRLDAPNDAAALFRRVRDRVEQRDDDKGQKLVRRAMIGLGDCALLNAEYDRAEQFYRQAQQLTADRLDQPQRMAKSGSYGYTVEDLLARDEHDYALKALDRWENELPVQKLEGYSFFLRGKVLFVYRPSERALDYLELAERVAPDAMHVPEAVWLRANCLMALERYEQALAAFARIRQEFTDTRYYDRAPDKIEQCKKRLTDDP